MKQRILRFAIHRPRVYLVSMILTFALNYVLGSGMYYYYLHEKITDYADSILSRSESLIKQIHLIDGLRAEISVYSPCSELYLHELRKHLWPFHLVKDIAYVSDQRVVCSALWGRLRTPLSLNLYSNKVNHENYKWVFDAVIEKNITADVLYTTDFAIFISPFAFQRFWQESEEKNFSAIISDYHHKNIFFKIGKVTDLLVEIEHQNTYHFNYITARSCSSLEDICIITGTEFPILFNNNSYILFFLICLSIVVAFLISALYIRTTEKNMSLFSRIESAILNNELQFVYQPIYNVEARSVTGAEALIRWKDHQLGNIGPDIFIPFAEKNLLIHKISLYVVEHALAEFAPILHRYNITLSINVNCSDICSDAFRTKLFATLERENIPGNLIMLEITERQNASIDDLKNAIVSYKASGVRFALDDFGTGYSNLNWLSLLDVEEIKIDKSLIDCIGTGNESSVNPVLSGLIEMLKNMPKLVVFEGVENEKQYRFLMKNFPGCSAQGWYFSKPLNFDEIYSLIAR